MVVGTAHDVDRDMTDGGHVFSAMSLAQARLVFAKDDIENPMQAVFYSPMPAAAAWAAESLAEEM